jgi:MFS family permease
LPTGAVLSPLRRTDFRRLWIAQTVSIVGDKVNQVALSIMVYRLTGSFAQMGLVFAITFLPAALFGLLAGPLVDRWDRRRTVISSDVVRAGLVALIPVAISLGLYAVYALAFLSATVSLFFEPSRMALIPSIVPEDELMAANALDMTTMSIAELLGIGFGGLLVASLGSSIAIAFWIDGATFLVSAAFVFAVAHRLPAVENARLRIGTVWRDLRFGLHRIRRDGVLRGVAITYAAVALCGGGAITLSILLALDVYKAAGLPDALRLTTVDLATTIGLLIGSVAIGMSGPKNVGRKYLWGIVAFGALFVQFAWVPNLWVAALVLCAGGIANQYFGVPMLTMLQTHTESATRGRVFAVRTTIARVASVIGLAGAGLAAQAYGVVPVTVVLGALIVAIGLLGFAMPGLRQA